MNKKVIALTTLLILMAIIGFVQITRAVTLPGGEALFETSLQDRISSTDTSMTLVANSLKGGGVLTGYHCFTLDEGRSDQEFICGSISGTAVTSLERGMSLVNGTTTVSSLQVAHRKGADVKVTDYPLIQRLRNLLNGQESIPNLIAYLNGTACSAGSANGTVCDKAYIDSRVSAGAAAANETTQGLVELATGIEAASTTLTGGTTARLALPTSLSTSSPYTTGLFVPVTQNNGKLSPLFLNGFSDNYTFNGTTTMATSTIASSTIKQLNAQYASTTAITTAGTASTTNLIVSNTVTLPSPCTNCTITAVISTSTTFTGPTTANQQVSKTVYCASPRLVSGGGVAGIPQSNGGTNGWWDLLEESYPASASSWTVTVECHLDNTANCTGSTITVYAMCVNP